MKSSKSCENWGNVGENDEIEENLSKLSKYRWKWQEDINFVEFDEISEKTMKSSKISQNLGNIGEKKETE